MKIVLNDLILLVRDEDNEIGMLASIQRHIFAVPVFGSCLWQPHWERSCPGIDSKPPVQREGRRGHLLQHADLTNEENFNPEKLKHFLLLASKREVQDV